MVATLSPKLLQKLKSHSGTKVKYIPYIGDCVSRAEILSGQILWMNDEV